MSVSIEIRVRQQIISLTTAEKSRDLVEMTPTKRGQLVQTLILF